MNSGKACGTDVGLATVLDCVTASVPDWGALFLPEFDGYTRDILPPESTHVIYRHYPGEGSFSIAWAINRSLHRHLKDVAWNGRAGCILLENGRSRTSLFVVGVHGAHGSALLESLTDVAALCRKKPRHSQLMILGDFNIDLLPTLAQDPWHELPGRMQSHQDRRQILQTFCSSLRLQVVVPSRVVSSPGGPFRDQALYVPFTRIPIGQCAAAHLPSLLDFYLISARQDIVTDSWVDWLPAFADHALVAATVGSVVEPLRPQRGKWHCRSWDASVDWMREHSAKANTLTDADSCNYFLLAAQDILKDDRTCAQRRHDRIPLHIRAVLSQAAECETESERHHLRNVAASLFHRHRSLLKEERAKYIVKSGRVFSKSKKLHNIEGLRINGRTTAVRDEWHNPIKSTYCAKWGCSNAQVRARVLDLIGNVEGGSFQIGWDLIVRSLDSIAKTTSRDCAGVSVLIIRAFVFGCPEAAVAMFSNLFQNSEFIEGFTIEGAVYGKESKCPEPGKTRAILPLPAVLTVADAIVASVMHDLIDVCCPPPSGVMFGARKGIQVLDIAHAAQLHLQKGGDNYGIAGLAQGDVATYYDSVNCLQIAHWLLAKGMSIFWVSAFLRLQLLPHVVLMVGGSVAVDVEARAIGTLTGSRSAVAAGRVPAESVVCSLAAQWAPLGVKTDTDLVLFAVWVDNYYAFGNSLHNAIHISESFEAKLLSDWGLTIKPSSRSVMSPVNVLTEWDTIKWPRVEQSDVLGHLISSDASPWPCWRRTEKSMWNAFWANCVGPCARGLSVHHRCRLMNRSVRPVLQFRNTRWPFTKTLADHQNRVQREMLSHFLKVERTLGEELAVYNRRRMRLIANLARAQGSWGSDHAERILSWAAHLERPRNTHSLAAKLYAWHGPMWLQERRLQSGVMRPATRISSGFLPKRWDESIQDARYYVQL